MLAFREGNFGVRLPSDITGVNGKIADAFNEIAATSESRARETVRVAHTVGKEGKLKQRMSLTSVRGGWADEVAAINTLIDDLVWPSDRSHARGRRGRQRGPRTVDGAGGGRPGARG